MSNPEVKLTLEVAVEEVLGMLTGLDLAYDPTFDRFRVIARMLNRALRANALEHEWSWYNTTESMGAWADGQTTVTLPDTMRPRVTGDDAVRMVELGTDAGDVIRTWAYFLPRDALHKYGHRAGLWVAVRRQELMFSRPPFDSEIGLDIQVPVMREPTMFDLPPAPQDPADPIVAVDPLVLAQEIDFCYPDIITARAAYYYALTDPVMQPRAQTLEALYKDLMYQAIERDDRNTDMPYLNDFFVPVQNGIYAETTYRPHPLADERR
jgi:hypothetical protein